MANKRKNKLPKFSNPNPDIETLYREYTSIVIKMIQARINMTNRYIDRLTKNYASLSNTVASSAKNEKAIIERAIGFLHDIGYSGLQPGSDERRLAYYKLVSFATEVFAARYGHKVSSRTDQSIMEDIVEEIKAEYYKRYD